jgi:5'-nucleotidase
MPGRAEVPDAQPAVRTRILLSNDDGILARGLALLAEVCAAVGQVTVVAPDREQSGTSHSLTLHRPLRTTRRPDGAFQVDGTPTDCVLLALGVLMPDEPDFVISGINHGSNMGEDVLYSGTVAAAFEGLVAGIPSIAISFAGSDLELLDSHRAGLERLVRTLVKIKDFPKETLLNINLPGIPGDQVKGVKVTHLGSRVFHEEVALMKDPWGKDIYWIGGGHVTWSGGTDSDFRAIRDGFISVTPLHMDMTNYKLLEVAQSWFLDG